MANLFIALTLFICHLNSGIHPVAHNATESLWHRAQEKIVWSRNKNMDPSCVSYALRLFGWNVNVNKSNQSCWTNKSSPSYLSNRSTPLSFSPPLISISAPRQYIPHSIASLLLSLLSPSLHLSISSQRLGLYPLSLPPSLEEGDTINSPRPSLPPCPLDPREGQSRPSQQT